jgi:ABC-type uncharacterized transport system substrate-binding protein
MPAHSIAESRSLIVTLKKAGLTSKTKALAPVSALLVLFLWGSLTAGNRGFAAGTRAEAASSEENPRKTWKILHIMSYHLPWEWTSDQLEGFKDALKGLDVEYKVFQMDTKRNSSDAWKEKVAREARELIESWKPDLVYTTDDYAQEYVAKYYVNQDIPFVFAGVNRDPEDYGFKGSGNITGVLEHEHFVQTVRFLQSLVPGVKRIAVVFDEDPTWTGVIKRMKEKAAVHLHGVEFVSWDVIHTFDEYRRKMEEYPTKADAVALLGIHAFKDNKGNNVPWQEVLKWTAANSRLPDFSFWKDRIPYGTLCAVYVSGYEQGRAAGAIARSILAEGKSPSNVPMLPTVKGEPILSLARAKKLGIKMNAEILLTVKVVEKFSWEE